jgi:4a-hydroxytetrahydrobiopterin dehydratase
MPSALNPAELNEVLAKHPDWKLQNGKLVREWTFPDFVTAMKFVNHIGALAEATGHHPDIDIRYNRVLLGLVSHDAGGITRRDAAMAETIDRQQQIA